MTAHGFLFVASLFVGLLSPAFAQDATPLVELTAETVSRAKTEGDVRFVDGPTRDTLELEAAPGKSTRITFSGTWDVTGRREVRVAVRNAGAAPAVVRARIENEDVGPLANANRGVAQLLPGEAGTVVVRVVPRPEEPSYAAFEPFMMYFKNVTARDNTVVPAAIARVVVELDAGDGARKVIVSGIEAAGDAPRARPAFLPFVDGFGQYVHSAWPGKIEGPDDFARALKEEEAEREDWPGPPAWNEYGGWAAGPTLDATGSFRVAKHDGAWWLVDPAGKLFWSHGPTGVGFGGDLTPVTEREGWFAELPARDDPKLGQFYKDGRGATYRYYQQKDWTGFDVQQANLLRKYGDDYRTVVAAQLHERMRSWGFNTLGNWSAREVCVMRRTPYTLPVNSSGPTVHYRFHDVFDPGWEPALRRAIERAAEGTKGDSFCIGYFVDNERWFGWRPRAAAIGEETLKNPPERAAKVRMVDGLKAKYGAVDQLNAAWQTEFASWDAVLALRELPKDLLKNDAALADCGDFGMLFAEHYLSTCDRLLKELAPSKLYLGPRFHGHVAPEVVALCARYADVVSYNIYDNPPDGRVNQYAALDVPILSTEWGVGSDHQQTPFRDEKLSVKTPVQRADEMRRYAEAAVRHPNVVGCHFFQFRDQPTTGRPDGEATLRGFVNVADTPNFELVRANRDFAYTLYEKRVAAARERSK